jgi:hypothetical protein
MNFSAYKLLENDLNYPINGDQITFTLLFSNGPLDFDNIQYELNSHVKDKSINKAGIYFWTFIIDNTEYKLYIGKANPQKRNGIINRLKDYFISFQPQSPNDYKICHFDNYMKARSKIVNYKIYYWHFAEIDNLSLSDIEKKLQKSLNPVFNNEKMKMPIQLLKLLENINQYKYDLFFDDRFH